MAHRVVERRWLWPGKLIAFYKRGSYPGHLPRSRGVQGCEALAKTMTGTVALALCAGYLAWVFVAQAAATAHRYTGR